MLGYLPPPPPPPNTQLIGSQLLIVRSLMWLPVVEKTSEQIPKSNIFNGIKVEVGCKSLFRHPVGRFPKSRGKQLSVCTWFLHEIESTCKDKFWNKLLHNTYFFKNFQQNFLEFVLIMSLTQKIKIINVAFTIANIYQQSWIYY